jgi:hypothetical protein
VSRAVFDEGQNEHLGAPSFHFAVEWIERHIWYDIIWAGDGSRVGKGGPFSTVTGRPILR